VDGSNLNSLSNHGIGPFEIWLSIEILTNSFLSKTLRSHTGAASCTILILIARLLICLKSPRL
jgi:hypothetical protein